MGVVARIYIVRHGETDANRNGILQGHTDTQLNEEGIAQAKMTANALEKVHLTVAYASDLSRASKVCTRAERDLCRELMHAIRQLKSS